MIIPASMKIVKLRLEITVKQPPYSLCNCCNCHYTYL